MGKIYYKNRMKINLKRNGKAAIISALFLSIVIGCINYYGDNFILNFISKNPIFLMIGFFLNIVTLLSIFIHMSFQNQFNEDHIKKISSNEFRETLETESENNQIKEEASFGV